MNAIILAAGMGTRLRPLTNDRPKCLVAVNGVPMVERQIQFLKEKGIDDIILISGYKAEALDFLKGKYGVDIVFNDRYDTCNNINSLYIVRNRFHDTYVLEGDVYMDKNVLLSEVHDSTYFARKKKYENEWGLEVDADNRLTHINIGDGEGYLMSGISYWKAEDCEKIIKHMEEVYATKDYTNSYWDNMVLDIYPELDVRVREIDGIYEIDTPEELREVEKQLLNSLS
jgi:L-glutamine-phosphate cytidylyltransferase